MRKSIFLLLGVFFVLTVFLPKNVFAAAGINRRINFQGKVVKNDGTNVADNNYNFQFSLWTTPTVGTSLWSEVWNAGNSQIGVSSGIFSVDLGTNNTFPSTIDFNADTLYLSIGFSGEADMSPRIRLTAVPYAFNAEKVGGLTVTNTTGTLTIPNGKTISFADGFTTLGGGITLNQSLATTNSVTFAGLSIGGTVAFTNLPLGTGTTVLYIGAGGNLTAGTLPAGVAYTATNGLNLNANAFGLGGTLTQNTRLNIGNTDVMYFQLATGNVGIGTTNPLSKLSVGGSGNSDATIYGISFSSTGYGIYGENTTTGAGVYGYGGMGVQGFGDIGVGGSGDWGVYGQGFSRGVYGAADDNDNGGQGIYGVGAGAGVYGEGTGTYGDGGVSTHGAGVYGLGQNGAGVYGVSNSTNASSSTMGYGVGVFAAGGAFDFYASSASGRSYFAGSVGIGTTNPNNLFQVADLISFSNADYNTNLGYQTGKNIVSGAQKNIYIGYQAGLSSSTNSTNAADANVGVGYQTLYSNRGGYENVAIGDVSLYSNTNGISNTSIGGWTLYYNTSGSNNTAIGGNALFNNTTGGYNTATGVSSLANNTIGYYNTASGHNSLYTNSEGSYNTSFGSYSLASATGNNNTAIGAYAGENNSTGNNNVFLGYQAGYNEGGSNKLYIANNDTSPLIYGDFSFGYVGIGTTNPTKRLDVAGDINLTGTVFANGTSGSSGQVLSSTGTGLQWITAGGVGTTYAASNGLKMVATNTLGLGGSLTQNTQIGTSNYSLSFVGLSGNQSLFIGSSGYVGIGTTNPKSLFQVVNLIGFSGSSTYVGQNAFGSSNASEDTAFGGAALASNTSGRGNNAFGYSALYTNRNGNYNIALGDAALFYNNSGANNIGIGWGTLYMNSSGINNIAIGNQALHENISNSNVALGHQSGYYSQTGINNVFIGTSAASGSIGYSGSDNNTIIGAFAGVNLGETQVGNVFLGYKAGYNEKGSNKLYIANNDTSPLIYGDFSLGYVGIGTTNPTEKLNVVGNVLVEGNNKFLGIKENYWGGSAFYLQTGLTNNGTGNGNYTWFSNPGGKGMIFGRDATVDLMIDTSGNIGIGTTNPLGLLQVNIGNTIALFVGSSGYVGIGTTNPTAKFTIKNDDLTSFTSSLPGMVRLNGGTFATGNVQAIDFADETHTSTMSRIASMSNTGPGGRNAYGSMLKFGTNSYGTLNEAMVIDYDGAVGIGTTNPGSYKLDVNGSVNISGDLYSNSYVVLSNLPTGVGTSVIYVDYNGNLTKGALSGAGSYYASNGLSIVAANTFGLGGTLTQDTRLNIGNTEVMYFQLASGYIGIGTTNPKVMLDVNGSASINGELNLNNFYITNGTQPGNSNFIGYQAGLGSSNAIYSNFIGYQAGLGSSSAIYSNFFGYQAGLGTSTVTGSNFFGFSAGKGAIRATSSNFFGYFAGNNATGANSSNFFGPNTGIGATSAHDSNFFGDSAGNSATGAYYSNFFGSNAGVGASNASDSNFIGGYAGNSATGAYTSNFFGTSAGYSATNAYGANFIGYQAGNRATYANNSNFIGYQAGLGATNATDSIFIGTKAGYMDTVMNYGTTGASIAIGRYAGTGGFTNSIAIGRGVINTGTTQVNIGNVLYLNGIYNSDTQSGAAVANYRVGIGTTNPLNALEVVGNVNITAKDNSPHMNFIDSDVNTWGLLTTDAQYAYGLIKENVGTSGGLVVSGASVGTVTDGLSLRGFYTAGVGQTNSATVLTLSGSKIDATSGDIQPIPNNSPLLRVINESDGGTSTLMTMMGSGYLGLGTTAPGYNLTVSNDGTSGTYIAVSNKTVGTSAFAGIRFDADAGGGHIYSTSGSYVRQADSLSDAFVVRSFSSSSGGLVLSAAGSNSVHFFNNGNENMVLNSSGYLGIGMTNPNRVLDIGSSIIHMVPMQGTGSSTPTLSYDGDIAIGSIGTGTTGAGRIWIRSSGYTFRFFSINNVADYSEYFYRGQNPSEEGDVMTYDTESSNPVNDTGMVKKASTPYSSKIIGVVTNTSRGTGYNNGDDTRIGNPLFTNVGLLGHIWTKVSTINGNINEGDPLTTSSIPGVAMKATEAGNIIGLAINSYSASPSTVGKIMVYVKPGWHDSNLSLSADGQINVAYNVSPAVLSELGYSDSKNEIENATYSLTDSAGKIVTRIGQYAQLTAAKISTGLLSAKNVTADNLAAQKIVSENVITKNLTTNKIGASEASFSAVTTNMIITPEGNINDVISTKINGLREEVKNMMVGQTLGNGPSLSGLSFRSVQLAYQTKLDGVMYATTELKTEKISPLIDSDGNPVEIKIDGNVRINGVLTVDSIKTNSIEGLDVSDQIASLNEKYNQLKSEVLGINTSLSVLTVATTGNVSPTPTLEPTNFLTKVLAEFWNKVLFKGQTEFEKNPLFNKDMAGLAILNAGETGVEVKFDNSFEAVPIINISLIADSDEESRSLDENYVYYVANRSQNGFMIRLNKAAKNSVKFSWTALLIKDAKTSQNQIQPTGVVNEPINPTVIPTLEPTGVPTLVPTAEPTLAPSIEVTLTPTPNEVVVQ